MGVSYKCEYKMEIPQEVCEKCRPLFEEVARKFEIRIANLERRLLAYENAHTPPSRDSRHYPKQEKSNNYVGAQRGH